MTPHHAESAEHPQQRLHGRACGRKERTRPAVKAALLGCELWRWAESRPPLAEEHEKQ